MSTIDPIRFSYNWNNKLQCKAFTTLRLHNPKKYKVGSIYPIYLEKTLLKWAKIKAIKQLKIFQLNDFMAHIDTGYNKEETIKILQKMYPTADWNTQELDFILLVTESAPAIQATLIVA